MLITRTKPDSGIFFAIWPRRTADGLVAFEWLHYQFVPGWGWGSCGHWEYRRVKYKSDAFGSPMIDYGWKPVGDDYDGSSV